MFIPRAQPHAQSLFLFPIVLVLIGSTLAKLAYNMQKHAGRSSIDQKRPRTCAIPDIFLKCSVLSCEEVVKTVQTSPRRNKELRVAQRETFLPACFCMGCYLCLELIFRVAKFCDVITCKPYADMYVYDHICLELGGFSAKIKDVAFRINVWTFEVTPLCLHCWSMVILKRRFTLQYMKFNSTGRYDWKLGCSCQHIILIILYCGKTSDGLFFIFFQLPCL